MNQFNYGEPNGDWAPTDDFGPGSGKNSGQQSPLGELADFFTGPEVTVRIPAQVVAFVGEVGTSQVVGRVMGGVNSFVERTTSRDAYGEPRVTERVLMGYEAAQLHDQHTDARASTLARLSPAGVAPTPIELTKAESAKPQPARGRTEPGHEVSHDELSLSELLPELALPDELDAEYGPPRPHTNTEHEEVPRWDGFSPFGTM